MNGNGKNEPHIKVTNIEPHIRAINERKNNQVVIYPEAEDKMYYLINGIKIAAIDYESSNPIPALIKNRVNKGENKDGRSKYYE